MYMHHIRTHVRAASIFIGGLGVGIVFVGCALFLVSRAQSIQFDDSLNPVGDMLFSIGTSARKWDSINGTLYFLKNVSGTIDVGIGTSIPEAMLHTLGGIQLVATTTPGVPGSCTSTIRGTIVLRDFGAASDTLSVCLRNAAGAYTWRNL